ncbi:signal peptidase II [Arthrobacter sp. zg-Y877]|uniref:signal peptidase II n=1 Tax=Arthrobacter sp. zg-Y877 TaxID=3049074 RepID=UPI0025A39313|nr:signal peptidase II [Arthrobacter sp. zg-Y877]MDM7988913.1 signal peptidase II [Arthrobacter sp. zg-Y877]
MTTSSPQTPGSAGAERGRARRSTSAYTMLALAVAAVVADQLTKMWVVRTMTEGQVTDVLPPVLRWHFIRNPGAAFSIGTDYTWVFTIIMVLVAGFLVYLMFRLRSLAWATALGLVLGGALGNLTDRLFREPSFGQGHVVDFIAFPNFAIFNIADSCVVSGVILVCLLTLRGIGMDGVRTPSTRTEVKQHDGGESR